jgi:UDP-GlcNAc3NAcA epimerase
MLARMEPILCSLCPEWIIVYGDTNSTLAGAMLAARLGIPIAHVEAGCRSGKLSQPEEQNRLVADQLSRLLFAASDQAVANLEREGIGVPSDPLYRRIVKIGDIQLDALLQNVHLADETAPDHLASIGVESGGYYLLTLHRAENTDKPENLDAIMEAVNELEIPVVFPVHPRTRNILKTRGISPNGNIKTIAPQGYLQMLALEKHARKVLTDSGGVQKEAFYLKVPCVTLREQTEWTETVKLGANHLAGANRERIIEAARAATNRAWDPMGPYGDGRAAHRVTAELISSSSR